VRDRRALTYAEVELALAPEDAFALLCAVDRVPDWVPGVADVRVTATDDRGRATAAEFVAMPHRASVDYRLEYEYDDDARRICWSSSDGGVRRLTGAAEIVATGGGCRLRYGVDSALLAAVPGWAEVSLREESPEPIARAFARWAERTGR
jgi:ribosome-associated toxin RatA of RatAB toxin-antitoxin module